MANADVATFATPYQGFNPQFAWSFEQLVVLHHLWPFNIPAVSACACVCACAGNRCRVSRTGGPIAASLVSSHPPTSPPPPPPPLPSNQQPVLPAGVDAATALPRTLLTGGRGVPHALACLVQSGMWMVVAVPCPALLSAAHAQQNNEVAPSCTLPLPLQPPRPLLSP